MGEPGESVIVVPYCFDNESGESMRTENEQVDPQSTRIPAEQTCTETKRLKTGVRGGRRYESPPDPMPG